jgi:hypothetical protein
LGLTESREAAVPLLAVPQYMLPEGPIARVAGRQETFRDQIVEATVLNGFIACRDPLVSTSKIIPLCEMAIKEFLLVVILNGAIQGELPSGLIANRCLVPGT